jgi:hypothetical protein
MSWLEAIGTRCSLLGLAPLPLLWLGLNALVLLALAGGGVARLERREGAAPWGAVRTLLASGLLLLATVVGTATLLGAGRMLSARYLLLAHLALLALFALAERSRGAFGGPRSLARWALAPLAAAWAPLNGLLARAAWRRPRLGESLLLVGIFGVLGFYLLLALFTPPLNHDSNSYRLARVALWLQEGRLEHFSTMEPRMNWVGQNAELVMLWLTGFFRREYPLVKLAQWGGGVLACLAVVQLGGWLGLSRFWRLGAAAILVGIPTVGTQFISSQTDLFTAGCLGAGLAFLPAALRSARPGDWLLVGLGVGLAVGAKATVLYWGPGLGLLLLGWAWTERSAFFGVLRGGLLAAAVALPLCGYNFFLNSLGYDSPVAPAHDLGYAAQVTRADPVARVATNALAMTWQLFEPHSNPLLPAALHEPGFAALLDRLAERAQGWRALREALPEQGGWRARGLNEDEASFGLLVALAAALGGLLALAGATRRGEVASRRAALLFVALGGFFFVFCWLQEMRVNQFRYFCIVAPFAALLAATLFASRSRWGGRALGALFVSAQLATAVHVGLESRNQGVRVLRDPTAARWYPLWQETRRTVELLGPAPLEVGLVLFSDFWRAPLLRSGVAHRWHPLEARELRDRPTLGAFLAARGLDALVADPLLLRFRDRADVTERRLESALGLRRAVYLPLADGGVAGPRVLAMEGVHSDRWTQGRATFWLTGFAGGGFELGASNPTPLARTLELRSGRESVRRELAPGERIRLAVAVAPRDRVILETTPPFVPAEHRIGPDERPLGLLLDPFDIVNAEGVFADRWTAPRARFRLSAWTKGTFELELDNPTPLLRTLRVRSALAERQWELPPRSARRIVIGVLPEDEVELEVSPGFVPSEVGLGDDERELGVLVRDAPADAISP